MYYYRKTEVKKLFEINGNYSIKITDDSNDLIGWWGDLKLDEKTEDFDVVMDFLRQEKDINLTIHGLKEEYVKAIFSEIGHEIHYLTCWSQIEDSSIIELCPNLETAEFDLGSKITEIWDTSKTPKLRELTLYSAKSLKSIEGLRNSKVEKLIISGEHIAYIDVTKKPKIDDISALETLSNLTHLEFFTAKGVRNRQKHIQTFAKLTNLTHLKLARDYFTFSQFAWLKSKLVNDKNIDASFHFYFQRWDETFWYAIIGDGMPEWIEDNEENNLKVYFDEFKRLVAHYKDDPNPPKN